MGLVRDPDAAARYAADPAQAIADAHLADVTSADVNNLIPMVSDSLSMAAPAFGADTAVGEMLDGNVWTSGAATEAFQAFDLIAPTAPADAAVQIPNVIDTAAPEVASAVPDFEPLVDSVLTDDSALLGNTLADPAPALWEHADTDSQPLDEGHTAFDVFD
nr:Rv0340 family IniB-related protein [Mycobacterium sp. MS1601]